MSHFAMDIHGMSATTRVPVIMPIAQEHRSPVDIVGVSGPGHDQVRHREFDFERAQSSTVVVTSSGPDGNESRGVSIAEASRRTGLSRHTLRYYERAGLIEPVERNTSGRREYAAGDLIWFAFLVRLRQTGMPINQMLRFAQLRAGGVAASAHSRGPDVEPSADQTGQMGGRPST